MRCAADGDGLNIAASSEKKGAKRTTENPVRTRKGHFIMEHDISKLEHRLRHVDRKRETIESISSLMDPFIHKPGWTTVAEYDLVMLTLDTLEYQLSSIERTQRALVSATQRIGDGQTSGKPAAGTGASREGQDSH
jgi:hypothetical protein